ncbi:hypothetical protein E2C01_089442 [Portunus trituberculatus]|uniref:Uncharacterized protein n=1 Tax=Portunus trituberculatus TaxID=210409 RepID=A0A5B7JC03_PORTR|nr:hypothetical protein [Portunus trituberculatus]
MLLVREKCGGNVGGVGGGGCGGGSCSGAGGGGGLERLSTALEIIGEPRRGGRRRHGSSQGAPVAPSVTSLQYFSGYRRDDSPLCLVPAPAPLPRWHSERCPGL